MTTKMICPICGKQTHGAEKYAPATVYHGKCLMKAMAPMRAKVTTLHNVKVT